MTLTLFFAGCVALSLLLFFPPGYRTRLMSERFYPWIYFLSLLVPLLLIGLVFARLFGYRHIELGMFAIVIIWLMNVTLAVLLLSWPAVAKAIAIALIFCLPSLAFRNSVSSQDLRDLRAQYSSIIGGLSERDQAENWREGITNLRFFYASRPILKCASDDEACINTERRMNATQTYPVWIGRLLFYFLMAYPVLRVLGQAYKEQYKQHREEGRRETLHANIFAESAPVLAAAAALILAVLPQRVDLGQLGLFGGLVGAGLSVALRDALGNYVAGILLIMDRTISKEDVITIETTDNPETGGTYGIVDEVGLRYTTIKDRDTVHRLIPNSLLLNSIVENWTHKGTKKVRLKINIPIPYRAPIKQVKEALESAAYEPKRVLPHPAPQALLTSFEESSLKFSLRFWIKDAHRGIRPVISEVHAHVVERLEDLGLTIPFPQLDIHIPEATDRTPFKSSAAATESHAQQDLEVKNGSTSEELAVASKTG